MSAKTPLIQDSEVERPDTISVRGSLLQQVIVMILAAIILGFSLWGFGNKFLEFLALTQGGTEGLFAITPVVNYLLASVGFFCLLLWATMRGMFHDIERPKYDMLENEARLDAARWRNPSSRHPQG